MSGFIHGNKSQSIPMLSFCPVSISQSSCNVCSVINYLYTNKHSLSATKILHIHIYNLNNILRKKKLTGIILILLVFQGVVFSVIIFDQPIDVLSISF